MRPNGTTAHRKTAPFEHPLFRALARLLALYDEKGQGFDANSPGFAIHVVLKRLVAMLRAGGPGAPLYELAKHEALAFGCVTASAMATPELGVGHHVSEAAEYISAARSDIDDAWYALEDIAAPSPTFPKEANLTAARGHFYEILQGLRAAERCLDIAARVRGAKS